MDMSSLPCLLRMALKLSTRCLASRCTPVHTPLTKTLVALGMAEGWMSSSPSSPQSSMRSTISLADSPVVTYAINVRFFTNPTACPSGVSAGHTIPQCVLCSCRGAASLPSRPMGELSRLKCDNIEANVSRCSTCDTPVLVGCPLLPTCQFPVAREYLRPASIVFPSIACLSMLMKFSCLAPDTLRSKNMRASLSILANSWRNSFPSKGPARSMRLLP
mmetsp:Transcript_28965/g.50936  ORF Transcript_28965/g.50936 Transcript_28965/m.50936 type:complete len:218 (+) Transcript_28965:1824-2477(+)